MDDKNNIFEIDYDLARKCYPDGMYKFSRIGERFRPAYLMTNENLRKSIPHFGNTSGDILTVAASGDQALYYALHGARRIDTFDQTFSAKAAMDLKTVMLNKLNYTQYYEFVSNLYRANKAGTDIMSVDRMPEFLSQMPLDSAEYTRKMSDCNIFNAGTVGTSIQMWTGEYWRIQDIAPRPFNFIWSNIADLHLRLDTKYDVINTSNIFEWMDRRNPELIVPTIQNLFEYLNKGGYIMATCLSSVRDVRSRFGEVARKLVGYARWKCTLGTPAETVVMLQRTR